MTTKHYKRMIVDGVEWPEHWLTCSSYKLIWQWYSSLSAWPTLRRYDLHIKIEAVAGFGIGFRSKQFIFSWRTKGMEQARMLIIRWDVL